MCNKKLIGAQWFDAGQGGDKQVERRQAVGVHLGA